MESKRFREMTTSSGKLILAGKNAKNNEELIAQVEPKEDVFHTAKPGSPFVNIKKRSNAKDRKEAAIFCARHSQDWRDNKKDVIVHHFKGKDIHKNKLMKTGTFGIRKKKIIKVKKEDIEKWQP
jgi:predicted ribosome quality control (RQC) complex YloA/Tae2 family protein